jgi:hypothetical protein
VENFLFDQNLGIKKYFLADVKHKKTVASFATASYIFMLLTL